jgi:hypothetical protein
MAEERGLTAGEARLCRTIFRDTIPAGTVRIIKRTVLFGGFTPFGNINASEESYESDYIGHTTSRPYKGVTGIALEGPTITTTEPRDGHPRDYWGATDVAMPEPD